MINLISTTIAHINSLLKTLQVKSFLAIVLAALLVLTTNVSPGHANEALNQKVRNQVHQDDSQRPKTTGEWNKEARETEGTPGKRLQKIGSESAEAFKQFGSGYVKGAKETASDVKDSAVRAGKDLSNKVIP